MKFEYSDDYGRKFADLAEQIFHERMYPQDLIDGWDKFVDEVDNGYDDNPPGYDNDLDIARGYLETYITENILSSFVEHSQFKQIIKELDERFIEVTQIHPAFFVEGFKWWKNRIPKRTTKEYVDFYDIDYLKKIGLEIIIVE